MNPFQDPLTDQASSFSVDAGRDLHSQQDAGDHTSAQSAQRQSNGDCSSLDPQSLPFMPSNQRASQSLSEKAALVKSLKGKEKEWSVGDEKKRPLQLLDLPVDILKEIIDKVGFYVPLRSTEHC